MGREGEWRGLFALSLLNICAARFQIPGRRLEHRSGCLISPKDFCASSICGTVLCLGGDFLKPVTALLSEAIRRAIQGRSVIFLLLLNAQILLEETC